MEGLKINLNFQPKNGQDPKVFNQMYMDYISNLGSEDSQARPLSQQSSHNSQYDVVPKQESSVSGFSYDDRNDEETQDEGKEGAKK